VAPVSMQTKISIRISHDWPSAHHYTPTHRGAQPALEMEILVCYSPPVNKSGNIVIQLRKTFSFVKEFCDTLELVFITDDVSCCPSELILTIWQSTCCMLVNGSLFAVWLHALVCLYNGPAALGSRFVF
jgi:hypothetical protein